MNERKTVCKVREITLNYNVSRMGNIDAIRDMILGKGELNVNVDIEKKLSGRGREEEQ